VFPHDSLSRTESASGSQTPLQFGDSLTPSINVSSSMLEQATQVADLQVLQALFRTRTGDPLLTIKVQGQRVATHGNGFGLFVRFLSLPVLRPVATGCNHGAP
jgi:hypothetical protein